MAIPGIPQNLTVQQGNGQVLLDWSNQSGATQYKVDRSLDGVTFSNVAQISANSYLDTSVTVGTRYFYKVASVNTSGTSPYTPSQEVIPTLAGQDSLSGLRLQAQQKADRVGSNFVTKAEWNTYINKSADELYDLLVTLYEDYFIQEKSYVIDGSSDVITLPSDFYKLLGVDCAVDGLNFQTLKKFDFVDRNRFSTPTQVAALSRGVNLKYRTMGNQIKFSPFPAGGQTIKIFYVPRRKTLLLDTDILDSVSGWNEYVIVDAAIKALNKEESDVQVHLLEKASLVERINASGMNRDAGMPDTISNTRDVNRYGDGFGGGYE